MFRAIPRLHLPGANHEHESADMGKLPKETRTCQRPYFQIAVVVLQKQFRECTPVLERRPNSAKLEDLSYTNIPVTADS